MGPASSSSALLERVQSKFFGVGLQAPRGVLNVFIHVETGTSKVEAKISLASHEYWLKINF